MLDSSIVRAQAVVIGCEAPLTVSSLTLRGSSLRNRFISLRRADPSDSLNGRMSCGIDSMHEEGWRIYLHALVKEMI